MKFAFYLLLVIPVVVLIIVCLFFFGHAPEGLFITTWEQKVILRNVENAVLDRVLAGLESTGWSSRWWHKGPASKHGEKQGRSFERGAFEGVDYGLYIGDRNVSVWPAAREALLVVVLDPDGEKGGPLTGAHRLICFEPGSPLPTRVFIAGTLSLPNMGFEELEAVGVLGDISHRIDAAVARLDEMVMWYALQDSRVRQILVEKKYDFKNVAGALERAVAETKQPAALLFSGAVSISDGVPDSFGTAKDILYARKAADSLAAAWRGGDALKVNQLVQSLQVHYPRIWREMLGFVPGETPALPLAEASFPEADGSDTGGSEETVRQTGEDHDAAATDEALDEALDEREREQAEKAEIAAFLGYGTADGTGSDSNGPGIRGGAAYSSTAGRPPAKTVMITPALRPGDPGDLNGDGTVTYLDFTLIKRLQNQPEFGSEDDRRLADLNGDDQFDDRDVIYMYWKVECRGDMNGDGEMEAYDLTQLYQFITEYLAADKEDRPAVIIPWDVDKNGELTHMDYFMLKRKFDVIHQGGRF